MVMTKEEKILANKEYYENNREKILLQKKEYRQNNKEKINAKANEYRQKHKEKIKEYYQTEKGKMNTKISNWKQKPKNGYGLICENRDEYEYIYDRWLNSERCEECNKEYTEDNIKNMDHCHLTGLFRNILCHICNVNKRMDNTSGTTNISWDKTRNRWCYQKTIKGKIHTKCSNDLEWLKQYKIDYEKENLYNK